MTMKKNVLLTLVLIAMFTLTATNVNAQDNKFSLGGGLAYATEVEKVGFFAKGLYQFTPQWEAAASFTYFLPREENGFDLQFSALDANVHYVFYNDEYKLASYMLSGIDVLFEKINVWRTETSDSDVTLGFNLGAGLRYQLSERLALNPEIKYVLSTEKDYSYFAISVGLLFNF